MTAEIPAWDHRDPLEEFAPTPAEHARAGELWDYALGTDDPKFYDAFVTACAAVLLEKDLPQFLSAIFLHGRALLEGNCADRDLAHRRLAVDVSESRENAIKEMMLRDD